MKGFYYLGFMLICSPAFGQTEQNSNSGASSAIEVPSQTTEKEKTKVVANIPQENSTVPVVHYKITPEEKAIRRQEEMPVMVKTPEQN